MNIFVDRILPLFSSSNLNDTELEKAIGLKRGIIYDWKKGRTQSYKKYCDLIAAYFNVSTDYLLGNTDDPTPAQSTEAAPLPFQLTHEARELLDIFFSLGKTGQDGLLQYARFLTTQQADTPTPAKSHLA